VELLWREGEEAMEAFTAHYLAAARLDCANLPFWEIYVASAGAAFMSEWGLEPGVEAEMRWRTEALLVRARRALG
jgi:hypothetical protein